MIRMLGNKKNVKTVSLIVAVLFILSIAGISMMQMGSSVNAAPKSDIGIVDMSQVFNPQNKDIVEFQELMEKKSEELQKEFEEKAEGLSDEEKTKIFTEIQTQLMTEQENFENKIKEKLDKVVAEVATEKNLVLIVDKKAVLTGGVDVTEAVAKKINS